MGLLMFCTMIVIFLTSRIPTFEIAYRLRYYFLLTEIFEIVESDAMMMLFPNNRHIFNHILSELSKATKKCIYKEVRADEFLFRDIYFFHLF